MWKLTISFFILLIGNSAIGQNLLSFSEDGKYGFIDSSGQTVIEPKYLAAQQFSEGVAFVYENGKAGLINEKGKYLIEPLFDHASPFKAGVAIVVIDSLHGLIDQTGKYIIDPKFQRIYFQSEEKIGVKRNDLWGFYSTRTGLPLTEINYSIIGAFNEGLAMIQDKNTKKYGFINEVGEIQIPCNLVSVYSNFQNGFAAVCDASRQNCFINRKGENAFNNNYYSVEGFHENYAFVKDMNYRSGYFIDTLGKRVSPQTFKNVWYFTEGFCGVQTDSSFAVINSNHEIVFESKNIELRVFSNGFGFFCDHSSDKITWGVMDTSMNILSEKRFVKLFDIPNKNFLEFYLGDANLWYGYSKRGYIDRKGEILWIEQ